MLVKLICRIEEWRDDLDIGDLAWRSFVPPLNSEQSRGENNGFLAEFGRYESMTRNLELSKLQQKGNNVGSRTTWILLYYHRKDIRSVSNYIIKITQQPVCISVERRESVDRGTRWNVIYIYNNMLLITLHHISKVNIYTYIYILHIKKSKKDPSRCGSFRRSVHSRVDLERADRVTKTLGGIKRMQRILLAEQWARSRSP